MGAPNVTGENLGILEITQLTMNEKSFERKRLLENSMFWDTTPCNPLKDNRRFGGTCRFHLQ
jgi:hypothetical protein